MMSSMQYSKGFLVLLIWQVWLPSFASSQTDPTTSESTTMSMTTSPVSMTSDSTAMTDPLPTTMISSSASASAASASPASPSSASTASSTSTTPSTMASTMASTTAGTTSAGTTATSTMSASTMSASTNMVSTSIASMNTDSTSMSSASSSSPDDGNNNSTISCRSFNCDGSNCYSMFMSKNSSTCPSTSAYCELWKWNSTMYSVRCADSCDLESTRCANDSQSSCVTHCCNMTDCLNTTLQNMEDTSMTTTDTPTTQPAAMTTMQQTTKPVTMPNNGKKCKGLSCTGTDCYKNTQPAMTWCYDPQNYCELKKTTEGSTITWMAGCANDCTQETACTSSTATCHQECCSASATGDCLKLDGSVAMPNSEAYRAIFSPLILLATSMLAWLIMLEQL